MTLTNQQPYTGVQLAAPYCNRSTKNYTDEEKTRIIKRIVSEYMQIPYNLLSNKTRKREVVEARQIAMVLIREYTRFSLKQTGLRFGGRDHSVVCHANNTVSDLLDTNKAFKQSYYAIKNKVDLEIVR
jgi:chromosomal replication initiator protein